MQRIDKFAHFAKVVAPCLPPVGISLIRLAVLSPAKGRVPVPAGKRQAPMPRGASRIDG